jgi:hypothetical protein
MILARMIQPYGNVQESDATLIKILQRLLKSQNSLQRTPLYSTSLILINYINYIIFRMRP